MSKRLFDSISNLSIFANHSYAFPQLKPKNPFLGILGNLGNPNDEYVFYSLVKASEYYEKVFYIPGPLEYTFDTYNSVNRQLQKLQIPRVYILENSVTQFLPNKYVIGSTLWSNNRHYEANIMRNCLDIKSEETEKKKINRLDYYKLAFTTHQRFQTLINEYKTDKNELYALTYYAPSVKQNFPIEEWHYSQNLDCNFPSHLIQSKNAPPYDL
jgi:hypothetical protein